MKSGKESMHLPPRPSPSREKLHHFAAVRKTMERGPLAMTPKELMYPPPMAQVQPIGAGEVSRLVVFSRPAAVRILRQPLASRPGQPWRASEQLVHPGAASPLQGVASFPADH